MSNEKSFPHDKQESRACPYCQRHFLSLDQLTLHIVTRHTRSGKPASGKPATAGGAK